MAEDQFFEKVGTSVVRASLNRAYPAAEPPAAPDVPERGTMSANARRWAVSDHTYWGVADSTPNLPSGTYRCELTNQGPILIKQAISTDDLLQLPDEASSGIISEFQEFWRLHPEFSKRGFLHKRGFLLWGPPGSGKTSTLQVLIKRLADDLDGVSLIVEHPDTTMKGLRLLRQVEPKRPLVAIMEDIDAMIDRHGEADYLALLDGEAQVDNVVFVATTNYPERLDRRFVDRPSRFDTIQYIGMPSADARECYLKAKEPSLTDAELCNWVRQSEGFSVAHLKEMIVAVRCFDQPLEDVVDRLRKMQDRRPTEQDWRDAADNGNKFGFSQGLSAA